MGFLTAAVSALLFDECPDESCAQLSGSVTSGDG